MKFQFHFIFIYFVLILSLAGCLKPEIEVKVNNSKKPQSSAPFFDPSLLTITVNQSIAETVGSCSFVATVDPTSSTNLQYKIVFSEAIDPSTLTNADITNSGSGGSSGLTWNITNCGDNKTFKLNTTSIVGDGSIVPTIPLNSVKTLADKSNNPSSSTDNSITFDNTRPTVQIKQSSSQADPTGGAPVKFDVIFSEAIDTSTFTVFDILLDGVSTATVAEWKITDSGNNKNFLLEAINVSAEGTIIPNIAANSLKDIAGNLNTAATYGADNTVTVNWSLISAPTIEQQVGTNASSNSLPIDFKLYFNFPVDQSTFTLADIVNTGTASGVSWTIINSGDNQNYTLRATSATSNGTIIPSLASNTVKNQSGVNFPASVSVGNGSIVSYDTVAPTVIFSQYSTQADPTATTPILFQVTFNEAIDPTTFTPSDIYLNSSSTGTVATWNIVNSGDDRNFILQATSIGASGTIIPNMQAGKVFDKAQNSNALPTYGTDNTVTFDNSLVRVTVNQHLGGIVGTCPNVSVQADPTNNQTINFLVTFNKLIQASSFTVADISNTGTGGSGGIVFNITSCGDNKNFLLSTSSIIGGGTIKPVVNVDSVLDSLGNKNSVSTSSDGSVLFSAVSIHSTINQHAGGVVGTCPNVTTQVDPVLTVTPINYLVTFDNIIDPSSFVPGDITNIGSGGSTAITWSITSCGDNLNFLLTASAISGDGTIIPTLVANKVNDLAGNINVNSTATDNSVLYDVKGPEISIEKYPGGSFAGCVLIPAQSDPSRTLSLKYLVRFDEVIQTNTFTESDITNAGSGGSNYLDWKITNCGDDKTYLLEAVAVQGDGNITPNIAINKVKDIYNNDNAASISIDNSVYFDSTPPQVTVEKHPGGTIGTCPLVSVQSGFTNNPDINFLVTFNEVIQPSSFTVSDIVNTGNGGAGGLTWQITNCGDDKNFLIKTISINGGGTIVPILKAFTVKDPYNNGNFASTSVNNIVKYDQDNPTVIINQAPEQGDPTAATPIRFKVTFSEEINPATFDGTDISLDAASTVTVGSWTIINSGDNINYTAEARSLSGFGMISPKIAAGRVQDYVGFNNSASTTTDNQVTFESGWYQEAFIKASNAGVDDQFGYSIDLDQDTIVVGAPFEDSNDTTITNGTTSSANNGNADSGAVYVYKRASDSWTQEAYIKASNNTAGDKFGYAVSVHGDTLIVGSPYDDSSSNTIINGTTSDMSNIFSDNGSVFVYKRTGTSWVQEAYIKPYSADTNELFGSVVSLNNDTIAVGVPLDDVPSTSITNGSTSPTGNNTWYTDSGVVYIFKRTGVNWVQESYIKTSSAYRYDYIGSSVSIFGDTVAVGVPGEDSNSTSIINGTGYASDDSAYQSGAVFIYKRLAGAWSQEAYVKVPNTAYDDSFGKYISLNNDKLAVAAINEDSNQTTITMGSYGSTNDSQSNAGAVYLFSRDANNQWSQEAYFKPSNISSDDNFGKVSLAEDALAIGVMNEDSKSNSIFNGINTSGDDSKTNSGAVYVYIKENGLWKQDAYIKASNSDANDLFGSDLKLNKETLIVSAPNEDSASTSIINSSYANIDNSLSNSGAVYVYRNKVRKFNPANFKVTASTENSISFSWSKITNTAVGFKLAYQIGSTPPADCSSGTVVSTGDVSSYILNSLIERETYSFRLCSLDSSNNLTNGVTFTYSTPDRLIEAKNFALSGRDYSTISLSWNVGTSPATGYKIAYFNSTTVPNERCTNGTVVDVGNVTTYTFSSMPGNQFYTFRLCAYDGVGTTKGNTLIAENGWYQEAYIKPVNNELNDFFGTSVALDENYLVVGATGEDSNQLTITNGSTASANNGISNSGAVYLYARTGSTWTQEAYFKASNNLSTSDADDNFGVSVAIDNDTLAISATGEDGNQSTITNGTGSASTNTVPSSGAVYVYKKTTGTWAQEAYIKSGNNRNYYYFGSSIDLNADTLAVGASGEDSVQSTITNGTTSSSDFSSYDSGAVFVYKRTGVNWAQQAYIKASNSGSYDNFGNKLDLDGDLLAVGATGEDSSQTTITSGSVASSDNTSNSSGAVYLYKRSQSSWFEYAYIKASNNDSGDYFGTSLSLSGDTLAVGSLYEDSDQVTITNSYTSSSNNSASDSGAVYIFRQNNGLWTQEAYLKASNADVGDYFGSSVSLVGDSLIVGAPGEDSNQKYVTNGTTASTNNDGTGTGAVYVFNRNGSTWTQEAYVKSNTLVSGDDFGGSSRIAFDGNTFVVGVPYDDNSSQSIFWGASATNNNSAQSSGAVYVFRNFGRQFHPAKFAIKSDNGTDVVLTWNKVTNATGYKIAYQLGKVAPVDCNSGTNVDVGDVSTYTVTGLIAADYSFRICSYDATFSMNNGYTLMRSGSAVAPFPNNPSSLNATIGADNIAMSWAAGGGGVIGYRLAYQEGVVAPVDCNSGTNLDLGNVLSYNITGVKNLTDYSIRICSYDGSGNYSTGAIYKTKTIEYNFELSDLYLMSRTSTTATLKWVNVGGATAGFKIAYQAGDAPSSCSIGTIIDVGLVDQYTVTALTAGTDYGFRVCAYDSNPKYTIGYTVSKKEGWYQESYLKAINAESGDYFGSSVAINNDTLVVGATGEDAIVQAITNGPTASVDNSSSNSGAAYVYKRNGNYWSQEAYIKASNSGIGDSFGSSVQIEGDLLIVSAPNEDNNQTIIFNSPGEANDENLSDSGAVYVYKRVGSTWSQEAYLKAPNAESYDNFGSSIDLDLNNNQIIVGAPNEDTSSTQIYNAGTGTITNNSWNSSSGAAYVFKKNAGKWEHSAYFKAGGSNSDYFGLKVKIKNEYAFVAAPNFGNSTDNTDVGAVYIYKKVSGAWTFDQTIKATNIDQYDYYGTSIDYDDNVLLVGAPQEDSSNRTIINNNTASSDNSAYNSGAVYAYKKSSNGWEQIAFIKSSNARSNDQFGYSLSFDGNVLVVGAPGQSSDQKFVSNTSTATLNTNSPSSGAAYVYYLSNNQFSEIAFLKPTNNSTYSNFGRDVSASGSSILVGATYQDSSAVGVSGADNYSETFISAGDFGAAYVFRNVTTLLDAKNVTASSTSSSITLNWISVGYGHTGFKLAYQLGSIAPINCSSGTVIDVGNVSTYTVSPLIGNKTYAFRLCAYNSSTTTNGISFSAQTAVSSFEVTGLQVTSRNDTSIGLSWIHGGAPVTAFKIAYSQSKNIPSDCNSGVVLNVGNVTSYTVTGLDFRKEYSFRVCGIYGSDLTAGIGVFVPDLGWYQEAFIKPFNNSGFEIWDFGYVMALDKDTLVVSAPEEPGVGTGIINGPNPTQPEYYTWDAGALYVYKRTGNNWAHEAYIKAFNADSYDEFGWAIDIDGDRMVTTAIYDASPVESITNAPDAPYIYLDSFSESGAIYIYKRTGSNWALEKYLKASNATSNIDLGESISLSGDTISVGTSQDGHAQNTITNSSSFPVIDWNANDSGAVYIFKYNGSDWVQEAYIKPSNSEAQDYFGYYNVLKGNTLAVGASGEDSNQNFITNGDTASADNSVTNSGAVYIFNRSNGKWKQEAYIKAANNQIDNGSIYSLSLDANRLAVGNGGDDSNQNTITNGATASLNQSLVDSGSVYVYQRTNTGWHQEAYIKAFNADVSDQFGSSVSISGNRLAVGAWAEDSDYDSITNVGTPAENNNKVDSGAVYVYTRVNGNWEHEAFIKAANSESGDQFGTTVQLDGDTLAVHANREDSLYDQIINGTGTISNNDNSNSGAVYVYRNSYGKYAPTKVIASSVKSKAITLRWTKRSSDSGYKVDYLMGGTAPTTCTGPTAIDVGWVDNYTFTNLQPNVFYSFIICPYNASSVLGTPQTFTQKTMEPLFGPLYLYANDIKVTSMLLEWENDLAKASGYRVAYKTGAIPPANCQSEINFDAGSVTSFRLTSLISGNQYSARVCPYDEFGVLGVGTTTSASTLVDVWYQEAFIKASNAEPFDAFGSSVDIFADTLVVGAPDEDSAQVIITNGNTSSSNNTNDGSGAVYIYQRRYEDWSQTAYIKPINGEKGDQFGSMVKIYDDTVAVSSVLEDSNQSTITNGTTASTDNTLSASGAVYVYRLVNNLWQQEAYIKASNANQLDNFGSSIALNKNTLIVGADREDSSQSTITNGAASSADNTTLESGAAYVYFRTGSTWAQEAYIKASHNHANAFFGKAVSVDENTLVVGAPREDSAQVTITNGVTAASDRDSLASGAVYVYKRTGINWAQEAYIKAANNNSVDNFGAAVDIRGDLIAVGAPREDSNEIVITNGNTASSDNNATDSGAVYLYSRSGVNWTQEAYVKAPNGEAEDLFGSNVKLGQYTLTVGAPNEDSDQNGSSASASTLNNALNSGAVYVYKKVGGVWSNETYLKANNSDSEDYFGTSLSMSGDTIVVGAPGESSDQSTINNTDEASLNNDSYRSGAIYVYRYIGRKFDIIKLTASDTISGDVQLDWNRQAYAYGYKIAYQVGSTAPADCTLGTIIDAGNVDHYVVTGLTPGQTYSFRVCGYNEINQLSEGAVATAIKNNPPPNPSNLVAQADNSQQISITWTSGGGSTTGFKVAYLVGNTAPVTCNLGTNADVGNVGASVITGFPHYATITIRVCAYNAAGTLSSGITISKQAAVNGWYQEAYVKPNLLNYSDELEFGGWQNGLDIRGNMLVVGAENEETLSNEITYGSSTTFDKNKTSSWSTGAAWVFERTGDNWSQEAFLKAYEPYGYDKFGASVSIGENNTVAISAPGEDSSFTGIINGEGDDTSKNNIDYGAVYIFKKSGSEWKREAYLKSSNAGYLWQSGWSPRSAGFGTFIQLSGDTLAVSSPNESGNQNTITNGQTSQTNQNLSASGAVYIYRNTGLGWYQEAYIKAGNSLGFDYFGTGMSFDKDTLVVGATGEDSNLTTITNGSTIVDNNINPDSGATYVYRRSGSTWTQEAYIKAINSETYDYFGYRVVIDGDLIGVIASGEDSTQNTITNGATASSNNSWYSSGAIYMYRRTGVNWAQEAYIKLSGTAIDPEWYSDLEAIDLNGDTLVVGNPGDPSLQNVILNGPTASAYGNGNESWDVGSVYVYRKGASGWFQEAYIQAANARIENDFGNSVKISGDTIAVSAPCEGSPHDGIINGPTASLNNPIWTCRGAVYVYRNKSRLFDPAEFYASITNGDSITLNWNKNTGNATGFKIAYQVGATAPVDCNSGTVVDVGNVDSYTISGLLPNTTYSYRICSYNASSQLSTGVTNTIQTKALAPELSNLKVKSSSNTSFTANWTSGGGVTSGFILAYQAGSTAPADCVSGTTIDVGNVNSYTVNALTTNTTYSLRVCSYEGTGTKSIGKIATVKVNDAGWNYVGKIKSDIPKYLENFGDNIKLSGSLLAVGVKADSSDQTIITSTSSTNKNALNSGAVYLYTKSGSDWIIDAYVKADNADKDDEFGTSFDVYEDRLVVGAPKEDSNQNTITSGTSASTNDDMNDSGAVYVYKKTLGTWAQEAYIKAANADFYDQFGRSVAIKNNLLVVGSINEDSNDNFITNGSTASSDNSYTDSGAAYIYQFNGTNWEQTAFVKSSDPFYADHFGLSVAIGDSDSIAISAEDEDSNQTTITNGSTSSTNNSNSASGAVFVYKLNSGVWSQEAYLKPSNNYANDYFGRNIKFDNDTLVVSKVGDDSSQNTITNGTAAFASYSVSDSGAVYIYRRTASTWAQEAVLKAGNLSWSDFFGYSISLSGNTIAVGTPSEDSNGVAILNSTSVVANDLQADSGAVYVYKRTGVTWAQEAYIKSPFSEYNSKFGISATISGNTLMVGSPFDGGVANSQNADILISDFRNSKTGSILIFENNNRLFEVSDIFVTTTSSSVDLKWTLPKGIATGVKIAYQAGTTAPANCNSGTVVDVGNTSSHLETGLSAATTYSFRICTYDSGVGLSEGQIVTKTTSP